MSLTARFHIDGQSKGIEILAFSFGFSQDVDHRGMIQSEVRSGLINITIPGTEDTEILQWMILRYATKDCEIAFSGFIDSGQRRIIKLIDTVLVSYHESYSDTSDITINLTLSARVIDVKGVKYESQWAIQKK